MRRMMAISGLCAISVAIALVGCSTGDRLAVHESTSFDELMPRPVRSLQSEDQTVPVERLQNVKVVKGPVPEAPAATADEAYVLEIGSDGAQITAPGPFGEIWGRVTLDQLVRLSRDGRVPCGRITDWPRLKWRGFMLDSVRNYLPPQGVKDVIDVMSRYKLNLFHWHLTENYAWRLESKRFPELQSERAFLHRHKGKFYTQEAFREIVDYAYARGVRVMPEFDFPGHALAFRRAFGFKTMSDPGVAEKAAALFEELCARRGTARDAGTHGEGHCRRRPHDGELGAGRDVQQSRAAHQHVVDKQGFAGEESRRLLRCDRHVHRGLRSVRASFRGRLPQGRALA